MISLRIAVTLLIMTGGVVTAHEMVVNTSIMYDPACCDEKHCRAIEPWRVTHDDSGWWIDKKWFVAFDKARQSPDVRFHACFWTNGDLVIASPSCLWVPTGV